MQRNSLRWARRGLGLHRNTYDLLIIFVFQKSNPNHPKHLYAHLTSKVFQIKIPYILLVNQISYLDFFFVSLHFFFQPKTSLSCVHSNEVSYHGKQCCSWVIILWALIAIHRHIDYIESPFYCHQKKKGNFNAISSASNEWKKSILTSEKRNSVFILHGMRQDCVHRKVTR